MSSTPSDYPVLRTIFCSTPGCWGWQDIVADPRAEGGERAVGGCRCGCLADDDAYAKWLDEQEQVNG